MTVTLSQWVLVNVLFLLIGVGVGVAACGQMVATFARERNQHAAERKARWQDAAGSTGE